MFRHPKYYKELRSRNKADTIKRRVIPGRPILDQVISSPDSREVVDSVHLVRANSLKLQAPSSSNLKRQASSPKHKGSSAKPQAASSCTLDPGKSFKHL